jgi:predicted transcriptional regulator
MKREDYRRMKMPEQLEGTRLAELTTDIVAAYVSSHQLGVLELPDLINVVGRNWRAWE